MTRCLIRHLSRIARVSHINMLVSKIERGSTCKLQERVKPVIIRMGSSATAMLNFNAGTLRTGGVRVMPELQDPQRMHTSSATSGSGLCNDLQESGYFDCREQSYNSPVIVILPVLPLQAGRRQAWSYLTPAHTPPLTRVFPRSAESAEWPFPGFRSEA